MGASNGGDTTGTIRFFTPDFNNPGRSGVSAFVPSDFTVNRTAGIITSVVTPTNTIELSSAATTFDPNAFTITHKHTASGTVFRTTTIGRVQDGAVTYFRADSTFDGNTFRFQQSQSAASTFLLESGPVVGIAFTPLRRETLIITVPLLGTEVHRETTQEFDSVASTFVTVSDTATTWDRYAWGWEMTQQAIDPTGANLISSWTYYQPGAHTGPNAFTEGLGQVHTHTRYDGHQEVHTYWLNNHQTQLPFAGAAQALSLSRQYNPGTRTTTTTRTVGGNTLSKEEKTYDPTTNISTTTVHSAANASLTTITKLMPYTADFGGQTASVTHPDGTLTTYTYQRHTDGGKTIVVKNGVASGNTVSLGKSTTTTTNRYGTVIRSVKQTIGYPTNITLNHSAVTSVDDFGRPLVIAAFPTASSAADGAVQATATGEAWKTKTEYSCCGVAKEIDMYGIPTYHAYDALRRHIKSNRQGVTTETVRRVELDEDDKPIIIVETHRYPESVSESLSPILSANTATLVSKSVSNLAGTWQESSSPDSTSATPGALVKSSSTTTTYQPAAGLSTRSVTTVPGNFTQTTDSFLDGRNFKNYGDLSPAMQYAYSVNATGEVTSQSHVDGTNLRETTTTTSDWAGRTRRVDYMGGAFATMDYNPLGQLVKSTDPDGVTTLFAYNPEGERSVSALDLNANGEIDYGVDTVSSSDTEPALDGSNPVMLSISKVWQPGDTNFAADTTVSTSMRSPDGLAASSTSIGVSNPAASATVLTKDTNGFGTGAWTTTSTAPDGTRTVTKYTGGLMDISENFDSANNPISSTSMRDVSNAPLSGYDSFKRPVHQRDSRTGVTTTAYLSTTADMVASVTDSGTRTTAFTYDIRGRQTVVTLPDTTQTTSLYTARGEIESVSGSRTYPVSYTYDYAGRRKTMTTTGTAGNVITAWNYAPDTGRLQSKRYNSNLTGTTGDGPEYLYTAAGRLETRIWERGITTTYHYDDGGRQRSIDYSDATPDVEYRLDCLGRSSFIIQGTQTSGSPVRVTEFTYDAATLALDAEIPVEGAFDATATTNQYTSSQTFKRSLDHHRDPLMRDSGWELKDGTTVENAVSYGHDAAGRLRHVHPAYPLPGSPAFTYSYVNGSYSLIDTVAGPVHTVANNWEGDRNVLIDKINHLGTIASPVSKYDYALPTATGDGADALGQRKNLATTGSGFDPALASATATGPAYAWGYNSRGELEEASDTSTANKDRAYQYDAIGNRMKTVNGLLDDLPASPNYSANALNQYTTANGETLPADSYDPDGNQRNARILPPGSSSLESCVYQWDAENRLVQVQIGTRGPLVRYSYDHQSRLISRSVGVSPTTVTRYHYDGWNPIAKYTGTTLIESYTWGMDLSGTTQGAGGVGGLLRVTAHGSLSTDHFYSTYDGNGNVSEYLDATGAIQAHYEYDPFGNTTVTTGPKAADFAHRFSTKPLDAETGLYYYTYRYYDPQTSRWASRDPIAERGGLNLYGFVGNNATAGIDFLGFLGLKTVKLSKAPPFSDTLFVPDTKIAGLIIQQIIIVKSIKNCDGTDHPDSTSQPIILYEAFIAFPINDKGEISNSKGHHDKFEDRIPAKTKGGSVTVGVARHYSSKTTGNPSDIGSGWTFMYTTPDGKYTVGGNQGRDNPPSYWSQAQAPEGGEAIHTLTVQWCLCDGEKSFIKTTAFPEKEMK